MFKGSAEASSRSLGRHSSSGLPVTYFVPTKVGFSNDDAANVLVKESGPGLGSVYAGLYTGNLVLRNRRKLVNTVYGTSRCCKKQT